MSELAERLIAENLKTEDPVLDLKNCGLDGTEAELYVPLRDATHIKTLILSNFSPFEKEKRITDLSPLQPLTNLQQIHFFDNRVSDLSPLQPLINLQRIDFSNNQVSDLSEVKRLLNLPSLKELRAHGNPLAYIPQELLG